MDFMKGILDALGSLVEKVLPTSPFRPFINALGNMSFLGYLNWFVPVGTLIKIAAAWGGAIGIYYLYSIILRWIKAIR